MTTLLSLIPLAALATAVAAICWAEARERVERVRRDGLGEIDARRAAAAVREGGLRPPPSEPGEEAT
ncbi:hypothetical protein [Actinomadura rupiterrae]|uniref:hypothetical protein n=1 Tax=Actinomadura rupiterrae TaxID=559627 RepID=UPI0020A5CF41|nr:hypothetical protein [Actinomadura rupiterrae]MCP2339209.1 hypothetical protein [Actinomadura rupiterrae]